MSDRLPVVAVVGRPNVGKSTFFNRVIGSRVAIVDDQPGVTRDRKYGISRVGKQPCLLVDTGGLITNAEGIDYLTAQQVLQAIEEARGIAEAQKIISEGLTPAYLTFHYIEQLGTLPPGSVVYVPTEGGVPLMRSIGIWNTSTPTFVSPSKMGDATNAAGAL